MQTDQVKAAVIGTWIAVVGLLGYLSGVTSAAGWTVLTAVAATPPIIMMRLWRAPTQTVSESIRDVLR